MRVRDLEEILLPYQNIIIIDKNGDFIFEGQGQYLSQQHYTIRNLKVQDVYTMKLDGTLTLAIDTK